MSLIQAIEDGALDRVRQMLQSGIDPSGMEDGKTPLVTAIDEDQPEIFAELLKYQADVNGLDQQGYTPLIIAAGAKQPEMVRTLLAAGATNLDATATDFLSFTALIWASTHGDLETVQLLLEAGADPNHENRHGQSPLVMAVERPKIVSLLIQHGADPNKKTCTGLVPLLIAAGKPRGRGIPPLLAGGADPNVVDQHGTTPLLAAVQHKLVRPVRWLLAAGADPNVSFHDSSTCDSSISQGVTPLIYAAGTGRADIVKALLRAGARWDARDERGRSALDVALLHGHADIADLLERAAGGAQPPRRRTSQQYSAMLLRAAQRGNLARVQEALTGGADPNIAATGLDHGKTPLMYACERGRTDLVQALIAAGADVNQKEPDSAWVGCGYSALHYAVESGHAECARRLLEAGADTEVFENGGRTPLMLAADYGHVEAARVLLEFAADPMTRRHEEPSPHDVDEVENEDDGIELDAGQPSDPNDMVSDWEENDDVDEYYDVYAERETDPHTALGFAARAGHVEVMKLLLEATSTQDSSVLFEAVKSLQPEAVRLLLDRDYSVHVVDSAGRGPLHVLGWFEATITLPKTKVPRGDRPENEWTKEANRRQVAIARMLLDAGARVNEADSQGRTPLLVASAARTALTMLVDGSDGESEYTSAGTDPAPYVRLLLEAGADPQVEDIRGDTALHHIHRRGFLEARASRKATRLLLEAGAQVNARNRLGQTPLMLAAKSGESPVVENLLRSGSDPSHGDTRGWTVMHYAIDPRKLGSPKRLLQLLIQAGADPSITDRQGRSPLDLARDGGHRDAARFLRKAGARQTTRLETKLAKAVKKNDLPAVRQLLDDGADISREVRGENAFVVAVLSQAVEVVEELVMRGADVHQSHLAFPYGPGSQALHLAAQLDDPALLELLLRCGANPRAMNARRFTPVTMAAFYRKPDNVQRLIEAGGHLDPIAEDFLELLSYDQRAREPSYQTGVQTVTDYLGVEPQPLNWRDGLMHWPVDSQDEAKQKLKNDPQLSEWAADYQARAEKLESVISALRPRLRESGLWLVGLRSGRGCSPSSDFVALFPTTNQFALIAAMGVYGNDAEISCPELVGLLRELHELEPFDLDAMKSDALDITFHRRVQNPGGIAKRLYKMCPDLIDQGFGKMSKLVDSLKSGNKVHFWWD